MTRVLVVEDDAQTAAEIAAALGDHGFEVECAYTGQDALDRAAADRYSAIVLDRMLPGGIDGLTVLSTLRGMSVDAPVLILSALSAVDERVRGLRAGGDDYLTKPFALTEMAARVEALLRRPVDSRETVLRVGALSLDLIDRTAQRGGRPIVLLPREFKLLEYLMRRPDQTVTRAMLLEDVWNYRFVPQTNLVDVHMGKLRRKIDPPGEPPMIRAVWGTGFVISAPA